jgi:uncharacterized integral membrane protein
MDRDDAIAIRKLKDEEKAAKEQEEYYTQIAIAVGALFFVLFLVFVGINELTSLCPKGGCGR